MGTLSNRANYLMQDRIVNSYVVANTLEGSMSNYLDLSTHTQSRRIMVNYHKLVSDKPKCYNNV